MVFHSFAVRSFPHPFRELSFLAVGSIPEIRVRFPSNFPWEIRISNFHLNESTLLSVWVQVAQSWVNSCLALEVRPVKCTPTLSAPVFCSQACWARICYREGQVKEH